MTNVLHLQERYGLDRHQDSIMASLAHRLDVAKASNNAHLVALLEQERQQVSKASSDFVRSHRHWWDKITQFVVNKLFGGSELQVCEIADGRDRWWVASNPQTGQLVYADSEAELRLWIEENYQGR